jgi:hypothetical protein
LIFQHFLTKQIATKYTFSDIFVEISAFYLIFAAYSMQNQKSLFDISNIPLQDKCNGGGVTQQTSWQLLKGHCVEIGQGVRPLLGGGGF